MLWAPLANIALGAGLYGFAVRLGALPDFGVGVALAFLSLPRATRSKEHYGCGIASLCDEIDLVPGRWIRSHVGAATQ